MRTIEEIEADIKETTESVQALQERLRGLNAALTAARVAADDGLPRCTLFQPRRFGPDLRTPLVITRKSPAGWLFVRPVAGNREHIYTPLSEPNRWGCTHRMRGAAPSNSENATYLIDVPKEFL